VQGLLPPLCCADILLLHGMQVSLQSTSFAGRMLSHSSASRRETAIQVPSRYSEYSFQMSLQPSRCWPHPGQALSCHSEAKAWGPQLLFSQACLHHASNTFFQSQKGHMHCMMCPCILSS